MGDSARERAIRGASPAAYSLGFAIATGLVAPSRRRTASGDGRSTGRMMRGCHRLAPGLAPAPSDPVTASAQALRTAAHLRAHFHQGRQEPATDHASAGQPPLRLPARGELLAIVGTRPPPAACPARSLPVRLDVRVLRRERMATRAVRGRRARGAALATVGGPAPLAPLLASVALASAPVERVER